ncbi:homoserine kinase [Suillus variegatus]|nr:homoserine kinase [Suillus variegatus]
MTNSFTIRVPATSANIGPGFDVVGLPLPVPVITYSGEGADEVPLDPYRNLMTRVALYVLRCNGHRTFPPALSIHCHNQIPFGRGLGSSGAAVIAGVLLGDSLGKLNLSRERMLDYALMVERHPDNVTAALVGGFHKYPSLKSSRNTLPDAGENWGLSPPVPPLGIGHYVRFKWNSSIKAVAIIPRFELSTAKARAVLPESYSRKDLVFNMQRLAVLTTALGQTPPDPELIFEAMKDRVHQPYRKTLIPGLPAVTSLITPVSHPGLLGICLSGAGPTILALATHNFDSIAGKIQEIFQQEQIEVDWKILEVTGGSTVDS